MKTFILFLMVLALTSCAKEPGFVERINTAEITDDCIELFGDDGLNINNMRNVVFVFDHSCSVCIAEYIQLCKYADECRYDSLTTVVLKSNDMSIADFYLGQANLLRPKHENVIIDKDEHISKNLFRFSQGRKVLLFDNRRLIFTCDMQDYMFKKK